MSLEIIIAQLISSSGEAKSYAMEAIGHAKAGETGLAQRSLEEASNHLEKAHKSQTILVQKEAKGEKMEVSMLLFHAQDHLMNAITVRDLATEMCAMYELIHTIKKVKP